MNILALNGSYRAAHGHTNFLLERLLQGATAGGAACETIHLARLKINRCLACGRCHTQEQHLQCVQAEKDDVEAIFQKMRQADLLVYATPVYVFGLSALLKTLIERMYATGDVLDMRLSKSGLMFHHIDAAVCSKPFVAVVCCDNLENETPRNAVAYFKSYAKFMDAPLVGVLVRNGGRLAGHGLDPQRLQRLPRLAQVYAAYEQAGGELVEQGRIQPRTQRRANQEIVPVPGFALLKRLPLRSLKRVFVERAEQMQREWFS